MNTLIITRAKAAGATQMWQETTKYEGIDVSGQRYFMKGSKLIAFWSEPVGLHIYHRLGNKSPKFDTKGRTFNKTKI